MTESNEYKPAIVIADTPSETEAEKERLKAELNSNWSSLRQDFINKNKVELSDEDITVFRKPRSSCKHCYGTGVEGVWASTSSYNPGEVKLCRCITNMFGKEFPDVSKEADTNKYLTFGAFREMMKVARKRYNLKEPENEKTEQTDVSPVQGTDQESAVGGTERPATASSEEAVG